MRRSRLRASLLVLSVIASLYGCQSQHSSAIPHPITQTQGIVRKLKLERVEYFDKNHIRIGIQSFPERPKLRDERQRLDFINSYSNESDSATADICFPTISNTDAEVCSVQGGYADLYWYVGAQPAGTTVSFYADGPSANVVTSNTFDSSQIDTTEMLTASSTAPITMNNLYHVYETCNGTICGEASIEFGVLCSTANSTCPTVTMTDNNTSQVFTPSDNATPFTVVGAQQSFSGSQIAGSGSGKYSNEGQSWAISAGNSPNGVIKGYTFADNGAAVQQLGENDISSPTIGFYWINASYTGTKESPSNPIAFEEVLQRSDGLEVAVPSISESYAVEGPVAAEMTGVSVQPTYGPYELTGTSLLPALHMGTKLADAVSPLGVSVQLTGVMPLDYAGSVSMTRLVNFSTTSTAIPGQQPAADVSTGQSFWADTCALYTRGPLGQDGTSTSLNLKAGAPILYTAESAPAYFPNSSTTQTFDAQEMYQDYFMFKPNTPNAIWVAASMEDWAWSGLVNLTGGKYQLVQDSYPTSPFTDQQLLYAVTDVGFNEPQWSNRRTDGLPCHTT